MSEAKGRILIADDEETARNSLGQILTDDGYQTYLAADGKEALRLVAQEAPDILLTDLRMPGMDGQEVLSRIRQGYPEVAVVVMTAHGTIRSAVRALREGAEDYLTKPIDVEELEHLLERLLKRKRLADETRMLRERLDDKYRFENIIGRSPEMLEVFRLVEQVAPSQASCLVTGESGTGKELIAQALHQRSPRRDAPFVKVSCAALPETLLESELFGHERGSFTGAISRRSGRFEVAAGGTVFLDEIGDVPLGMQVKLLRFLQERQFERIGGNVTLTVDVRVIAATHRDLPSLVREGKFREDFYYRLNVIEIPLPPLRSRSQDIPLLVDFFVRRFAANNAKEVDSVTDETLAALTGYAWPGNVRELEHAIERAVVLSRGNQLDLSLFPVLPAPAPEAEQGSGPLVPGATLEEIEREAIMRTLESVGGSTSRAAAILKISPRTIQYKIKQYRLGAIKMTGRRGQAGERSEASGD
ncbi:MAG TPA: sigma-54 dependent transcriptional regulator [Candidatus Polarisedimenticolia bacterium]|nr:sigma-54 dependent transcriptional regulator [Candidatus Polarisedimenticolia bacterium]